MLWLVKQLDEQTCALVLRYYQQERDRSHGSMCSGSDAPILVAKAYSRAMAQLLGGERHPVHHAFSVELSRKKRKFLARMFRGEMKALYVDVLGLAHNDEAADDLKDGVLVLSSVHRLIEHWLVMSSGPVLQRSLTSTFIFTPFDVHPELSPPYLPMPCPSSLCLLLAYLLYSARACFA